ncbi:MAG TPA: RodZ domain-containing protein [Methylomirabilota bacterium]|nr:RodZ domain-containing protein [Methylomirabilota bacterium]
MASVGEYLRELRDRRGISLVEISRVTRVASRYLEALETDRPNELPAPVFTRGFIRAYCQALGEAPDEALARYDGREGAPVAVRPAPAPAHAPEGEPRSRSAVLVSFVLLVILGMALFAVALMTQPAREERAERRPPSLADRAPAQPSAPILTPPTEPAPPAASAPPRAPAPPVAAAPTPAADNIEAARAAAPPPWLGDVQAATGGVASPYRLVARVKEPTWIRVRTEDGRSTEETVPAGQTREWVSNRPFVLTLGNAGGVTLELNGRTLPPLGPSGAVIARIVLPPQ